MCRAPRENRKEKRVFFPPSPAAKTHHSRQGPDLGVTGGQIAARRFGRPAMGGGAASSTQPAAADTKPMLTGSTLAFKEQPGCRPMGRPMGRHRSGHGLEIRFTDLVWVFLVVPRLSNCRGSIYDCPSLSFRGFPASTLSARVRHTSSFVWLGARRACNRADS